MINRVEEIKKDFNNTCEIFAKWIPSKDFVEIFDKSVLPLIDGLKKELIKILEVGCGHGTWLEHLYDLGYANLLYKGIDLSPKRIKLAKDKFDKFNNVSFEVADFLTYSDKNKYHIIFFIELFQYVRKKDFDTIFKKSFSFLNNDGFVVIIDKTKYSPHSLKIQLKKRLGKLSEAYSYVNYPSFHYLSKLAKKNGFEQVFKDKTGNFHSLVIKNLNA